VKGLGGRPTTRTILNKHFAFLDKGFKKLDWTSIIRNAIFAVSPWLLHLKNIVPAVPTRKFDLATPPKPSSLLFDFGTRSIESQHVLLPSNRPSTVSSSPLAKSDRVGDLYYDTTDSCIPPRIAQEDQPSTLVAHEIIATPAKPFTQICPNLHAESSLLRLSYSHSNEKEHSDHLSIKHSESKRNQPVKNKMVTRAFVALGSNMGDRFAMIEWACKEMENAGISVARTSGLWETKPMYVEDQDKFLNGVCEV
jgi:hypothetical protein